MLKNADELNHSASSSYNKYPAAIARCPKHYNITLKHYFLPYKNLLKLEYSTTIAYLLILHSTVTRAIVAL